MKIGGFQKLSLEEFPGKLSCIVFTSGCNLRCGYCHNHQLILDSKTIPEKDIFDFLKQRKKLIDAVVISGGEPTIQPDIIDFVKKIKEMNYFVKIETNGTIPEVIEKLINIVDFISMDYKYPLEKYAEITGPVDITRIKKSKEILMNSKIPCDFHVTVIEQLFSKDVWKQLAKELKGCNVVFQKFKNEKVLDPKYSHFKTSEEFMMGTWGFEPQSTGFFRS